MASRIYAVIMAGGRGTRFWPRSRTTMPKQVLNVVGDNTMIQDTLYRLADIVPPENVYVVTSRALKEVIENQLPEVPKDQIVAEPRGRNTAPCIALAAGLIAKKDPDAIMLIMTSDHLVKNVDRFVEDLAFASSVADNMDKLVTFGIRPEKPETGFGYIQVGAELTRDAHGSANNVLRFVEKPDEETAERFFKSGDYLINSGMFAWKLSTIVEEFQKHLPDLAEGLAEIRNAAGTPDEQAVIEKVFPTMTAISIDYGILEQSSRVVVVPAGFDWNDLGSWSAAYDVRDKNEEGNVIIGNCVTLDAKSCYLRSEDKLVAVLGVEDMVVVETKDAILVCKRGSGQHVGKLVDIIKEKGLDQYL